jgi:hypothetical protein
VTSGGDGSCASIPAAARVRPPAAGHGMAGDRRRILVCDAESQSPHALRIVLHGAGLKWM